jgi:site-specific DNA-methyltransferase (cytosine-N4-specific)
MAESKAKKISQIELFKLPTTNAWTKRLEWKSPFERERIRLENKYESSIEEKLELSRLVSFQGNKTIPLLRLYRYKEAFSFELVKTILQEFSASSSSYVFDPFCGMGTTLLAAMSQRIPSLGIDLLPVAVFIAKTIPLFLQLPEKQNLEKVVKTIIAKSQNSPPAKIAEEVKIIKLAFDPDTLLELRKIKSAIDELASPLREIFTLLFLSILEDVSYTSKDGQFLRLKPDKKIPPPGKELERKAQEAQMDLSRARNFFRLNQKQIKRYSPKVYQADTRDLSRIPFQREPDIIITSPPYANRYDYTRSYALELCFHFIRNFEELKDIRNQILRSHIESKITEKDLPPHPAVQEIISALCEKELNNPKIPDLLIGYFCDMASALKQWSEVLAQGAKVALVVDNVRFEGEMVPVDLILSDLAEQSGFEVQKIIIARYKGNSSQQMKKYGRKPVRESILLWRKK